MVSQLVFQDKKEIERLKKQRNLFLEYERPVIDCIFKSKGTNLSVLDIGCNEGEKTVSLFSSENVGKVIGLEYNSVLAEEAEKERGSSKFSFYNLDVESPEFIPSLKDIMEKENVKAFDIIYLSFVLLHLKKVDSLLKELGRLLSACGVLVVVEADDSSSFIVPDEDGLLKGFMEILDKDKYSGNRRLGGTIEKRLIECGYNLSCPVSAIIVPAGESRKRDDIYTVYFSYLEEDVALLLKEDKDNEEYKAWKAWLNANSLRLEKLIKDDNSYLNMGLKILVCQKGVGKNV